MLRLDRVTKVFRSADRRTLALDGISLDLDDGEFLAVVGPSGSGKSTLLQIAAGLLPADSGRVLLDDVAVTAPPREVIYVFQQYTKSLFPWRTVQSNVEFALEGRRDIGRDEIRRRARSYLEVVGLREFTGHYPWQLSGGMQQRVAIARALAAEPRIMLMDEPFSALDALTRLDLQKFLLDLWASRGLSILFVTHDVEEAIFLADRVAVLTHRPARVHEVVEVGLPRPRDSLATREAPRFLELRHSLLAQLMRRPPDDEAVP